MVPCANSLSLFILLIFARYMTSNLESLAKPMSAIQCLDVVLRCAYENNPNFVRVSDRVSGGITVVLY